MNARILLIFIGWAIPAALFGQSLPPSQQAPLYEHLLEINNEWRHYSPPEAWQVEPVKFETDDERIQLHLKLVHQILAARTTPLLSVRQVANRKSRLSELVAYYEAGVFPRNTRHTIRTPYFIDDYGTACAVGHLLIESGGEAFAARIQTEMNYAYIEEMTYPELTDWADEQGLAASELAWIQPGYPPADPFTRLGSGANGPVSVFVADTTNDVLYIAGDFSEVNGISCENIIAWNGSQLQALGAGIVGNINAMAWHDGLLYVGGNLADGSFGYNLAVWDGTVWTFDNVLQGEIMSLHVHDGKLYAGGNLSVATLSHNVAVLETGAWTAVGNSSFGGAVNTLTSFQGDLVAGGAFVMYGTDSVNYVARYQNGSWNAIGSGLDNVVYTLLAQEDSLYAGGAFFDAPDSPTFGLARIDTADWRQLINPEEYVKPNGIPYQERITSLVLQETGPTMTLHVGGHFGLYPLVGVYGDNIATLGQISNEFYLAATAQLDAPVEAMAVFGYELFIGGQFTGHLSKTGVIIPPLSIDREVAVERLKLKPNPVTQYAFIELAELDWKPDMQIRVLTQSGQEVSVPYTRNQQEIELQVEALPKGTYLVEIRDARRTLATATMLIQ